MDFLQDWWKILLGMFAGGALLKYIQFLMRNRIARQKKRAELEAEKKFKAEEEAVNTRAAARIYSSAIKDELGTVHTLGSPDITGKALNLDDVFVALRISESWRGHMRFDKDSMDVQRELESYRHRTPEEVMKRAFERYKLLLIIGDPGSGKTTLLKYYAMCFLDKSGSRFKSLGFSKAPLVFFYPLRELDFDENNRPVSLPKALAQWAKRHVLKISADLFLDLLEKEQALILLDGLDEISSKERRISVCKWVGEMCGLENARFVLTSRGTGYRKLDGIELGVQHLRADIMDFSSEQQAEFLKRWFRAAYTSRLPPEDMHMPLWKRKQEKAADQKSKEITDFLNAEENKAVRDLAAVPMLLQIIAIIWKDHKHLPRSRPELYDAALNYLLDYRDRERDIKPLMPKEESRKVLAPTALWMQEELREDEVRKEDFYKQVQPGLENIRTQTDAEAFCEFLCDRAGLIVDYDTDFYVFRHKSFKEFLAGVRLNETFHQPMCLDKLVEHFKDEWWEETFRFFISKASEEAFNRFMDVFFHSETSRDLDAGQLTFLLSLIQEAPFVKIDALKECLKDDRLKDNQKRYVIECLRTIGTSAAVQAVIDVDKSAMSVPIISLIDEFIAKMDSAKGLMEAVKAINHPDFYVSSFLNRFEGNVEYIHIPGNTYNYSVGDERVTVPDIHFCKYPVTNQRYRRFIHYLEGKESEFIERLPIESFAKPFLQFAQSVNGYTEYAGEKPGEWAGKFRSRYDDDKQFHGDEQPVVGVSWYAARAYCFWLSCLESALKENHGLNNIEQLTSLYRLPNEMEWEWAAGGEPDGSIREFPWPKDKGEPSKTLANYDGNVGATTQVGIYPEGATPSGLMDMAGSVFEWMGNRYRDGSDSIALRGGSWGSSAFSLRCSSRDGLSPQNEIGYYVCFRVVRGQS